MLLGRVLVGLLLLSLVILSGCGQSPGSTSSTTTQTGPPAGGTVSISNGQNIYLNSVDESGTRITYSGGPGMGMMQGTFSCATCHGPDGHGGRVTFMMQTYDVPGITWPDLTNPDMDHPPYTDANLKQAITRGIDPAGGQLEYPMPRWQMSTQDLSDLAGFIETLK
jgi:cytochrome c oxidase subunit 2